MTGSETRLAIGAVLTLGLLTGPSSADIVEAYPALEDGARPSGELVIFSSTDLPVFEPVVVAFQRAHPGIAVTYHELNTIDIYDRFVEAAEAGEPTADLLLSSALDLQIKLVNDGYTTPYSSELTRRLPRWANWRDEAFGFTYEPVVTVFNRTEMAPADVPRTRYDLARLLDEQPARFSGRVGTYDLERSGAGFLFATQDARESDAIWALARSFGASGVKLYSSTTAILDRVATGQFLIGYNVMGSYAMARAAVDPQIGMVLQEDYTLVVSRIAVLPNTATRPDLARLFLDFLLSERGQGMIAAAHLFAIHPNVEGDATAAALRAEAGDSLRPIQVGPGLLVYLDQAKRERFLERWQHALSGR